MKKYLGIALFLWVTFSIHAQTILKESFIQKSDKNVHFYSRTRTKDYPPYVSDGGGEIFVIKYMDQVIGCDHNLTKIWGKEANDLKPVNYTSMANQTSYQTSNKTTFFDIIQCSNSSEPTEVVFAEYNLIDGKSKLQHIPFDYPKTTSITDFFALEDGLYFIKLHVDKKTKNLAQYLVKIDADGKLSETKLSLPSFREDEIDILSKYSGAYTRNLYCYRYIGQKDDKIILMKGSSFHDKTDKTKKVTISIGGIDKNGTFTSIADDTIPYNKSFTEPVGKLDVVNNLIYVAGYLMGNSGFTGLYYYAYDISASKGNSFTFPFKVLNDELKPSQRLDQNIMFAEIPEQIPTYHKIDLDADFNNRMALISLVSRNDLILQDGFKYLYLTPEGKITEIAKLFKKGGDIKDAMLYSDNSRKVKTGVDYFYQHHPDDKNRVAGFYIYRDSYSILVELMETNSVIKAIKLKEK